MRNVEAIREDRRLTRNQEIGVETLTNLALDLRWSSSHRAEELWAQLDPELWASTHNPWAVLQAQSAASVREVLAQPDFRRRVEELHERRRQVP